MRHWLWYKADGSLGGEALHPSGFDHNIDMNNSKTPHPAAVAARDHLTQHPEFSGFIHFDCACDPAEVYCDCARQRHIHYYHDSGVLRLKPTWELVLDGEVIPFGVGVGLGSINAVQTLDRAPGAVLGLVLRIKADSPEPIPDGTTFLVRSHGVVSALRDSPTSLVFSGGQTPAAQLVVPAQGLITSVGARPREERRGHPQGFILRSWGS